MEATTLPDADVIVHASALELLDATGKTAKFGAIFNEQKTIIVFIRHFFCGRCQEYVKQLAAVPKEALDAAGTKIVIVGCGDWNAIHFYAQRTGFQGPIFSDSSCKLYHTLGMNIKNLAKTPEGQEKRSYLTTGGFVIAMLSIWTAIKNSTLIGKQGDISQLGGDFIFGPGQQCLFASRMQHTEDHVEISDLMKVAGVRHDI